MMEAVDRNLESVAGMIASVIGNVLQAMVEGSYR